MDIDIQKSLDWFYNNHDEEWQQRMWHESGAMDEMELARYIDERFFNQQKIHNWGTNER